MSRLSIFQNWTRLALLGESAFVMIGGLAIALAPEEACERMAALRGLAMSAVACPSYVGGEPVFEMYTLSLGKHQAMLAMVFAYFALAGSSEAAINIGLAYLAVAASLDVVPVVTWFSTNDLVVSSFPGIFALAFIFTAVAVAAIPANHRNSEWIAV